MFLPLLPKCWDYMYVPLCLVYILLRREPNPGLPSCLKGKHCPWWSGSLVLWFGFWDGFAVYAGLKLVTLFLGPPKCQGCRCVRARATAWWALVMVRAYSGHKMPVISEWRSSGMSKLSSLSLCDVHRGKKQRCKSNLGFVCLAELPEKHMCRFQDEHSDQEKKATWDFPTYERKEKNTMIEKRKGKQKLISLSWTWNWM